MRDRITNQEFENKLLYPTDTVLDTDPTYVALVKEQCQLQGRLDKIKNAKKALIHTMRQKYDHESFVKRGAFRTALEEDYGTQEHPNRDKIWQKAWDDGHSGGYMEVLIEYDELANLVL